MPIKIMVEITWFPTNVLNVGSGISLQKTGKPPAKPVQSVVVLTVL
jgi:hypothetical protein